MLRPILLTASLLSAGLFSQSLLADNWTLQPLGLTDDEHRSVSGSSSSIPGSKYSRALLNEAGHVAGISYRWEDKRFLGYSAWFQDGSEIQKIGLIDDDHTSKYGVRLTSVLKINETGHVVGRSTRYASLYGSGYSSWIFDGSQTRIIGLLDSDHLGFEDSRSSQVNFLNDAGQVAGTSKRYGAGDYSQRSAWLYDGDETFRIGLYDDDHTQSDGYQYSEPAYDLNEAGQVLGYSERFNDSVDAGRSVWFFDGNQTQRIGLYDSEHSKVNGYQNSTSLNGGLNDAGQAVGNSNRYLGNSEFGKSAWLFDDGQTRRIGLLDSDHTGTDGYQYSEIRVGINETGHVAGISHRYNGTFYLGKSAWLYNDNEIQRIGLFDGVHTKADGTQISEVVLINEAGQVAGSSDRFSGNVYFGTSAWIYTDGETLRLGVYDSAHTSEQGFQYSEITHLNDTGLVMGLSYRYDVTIPYTLHTLWLYDANSNKTYIIPAPSYITLSSIAKATSLGKNGLVLGYYSVPNGDPIYPEYSDYPFGFTIEKGFLDLTEVLSEASQGELYWNYSSRFIAGNSSGQIAGYSRGTSAFLLSPKNQTGSNDLPRVAITSPTANTALVEGASVTFSVDASDPDGSITKVEYYAFGTELFATATEAPFSISVDNVPYGTFDITAVAYDNDGDSASSEVVTLTVNANDGGNIPPSITITSPSDSSELIEGAPVIFTVDASDADGSVTKVEYYAFGDQLFGAVTEAPFTLNVDRAPYGTFDITAVVYDDKGASTVSPAIVVKVVEPTNLVD